MEVDDAELVLERATEEDDEDQGWDVGAQFIRRKCLVFLRWMILIFHPKLRRRLLMVMMRDPDSWFHNVVSHLLSTGPTIRRWSLIMWQPVPSKLRRVF